MTQVQSESRLSVLGEKRISVFCTALIKGEDNAVVRILEEIATTRLVRSNIRRLFPVNWTHMNSGEWKKTGEILLSPEKKTIFKLTVILGLKGERPENSLLLIRDRWKNLSMKPIKEFDRAIKIGGQLSEERVRDVANQLVALWVVYGCDWMHNLGKKAGHS